MKPLNTRNKEGLSSLKKLLTMPQESSKTYKFDPDAIDDEVLQAHVAKPDRFAKAEDSVNRLEQMSDDELYDLA